MEINGFEIIGKCLFWQEKGILILGDLHLGYEEMLKEQGLQISFEQVEQTLVDLKDVFAKTGKVNGIILLGDIKHNFGEISNSEYGDVFRMMEFLKQNMVKKGKIVITKGNHDTILAPVIRKYDFISLVERIFLGDVLFFHGDAESFKKNYALINDKKIRTLVIGHFHPAVNLIEDVKKEKYKCFLFGKIQKFKKDCIILPSFFPLVEGVAVNERILESWLDISNLEVYAVAGQEIFDLGIVKKLKKE